jgi:hypothetical protein
LPVIEIVEQNTFFDAWTALKRTKSGPTIGAKER